jgi:hypothetical protein
VQSALATDDVTTTLLKIKFNLIIKDDNGNPVDLPALEARVVKLLDYDLILGLPTISKFDLLPKLRSQIYSTNPKLVPNNIWERLDLLHAIKSSLISTPTIVDKADLLDIIEDEAEFSDEFNPLMDPSTYKDLETNLRRPKIFGSSNLRKELHKLHDEFLDIFSISIDPEPAKVPPMELKVDINKWHLPKNKTKIRPQSSIREQAMRDQTKTLLNLGALIPVQCEYYSQALMVTKPNGQFRFCIDFRNLNSATESYDWPLPNIRTLLRNIGEKKPKI